MSDSEESRMVSDAIEGGVKTVRGLGDYFCGLVGSAQSYDEIRRHSAELHDKMLDIVEHLMQNPNCFMRETHLAAAGAITEFYLAPVASAFAPISFQQFKERTVNAIAAAVQRRVDSMRGEKSQAAVREMVHGLKGVEAQLAQEELAHGATRH